MAGSEDDEVKGREVKDLAGDPASLEALRGPDLRSGAQGRGSGSLHWPCVAGCRQGFRTQGWRAWDLQLNSLRPIPV